MRKGKLWGLYGVTLVALYPVETVAEEREKASACKQASKMMGRAKNKGSSGTRTRYGDIQKKLFKGHFRIMWTAWSKKSFCNGILGQRTISVQIFKIFGCHQNHGY